MLSPRCARWGLLAILGLLLSSCSMLPPQDRCADQVTADMLIGQWSVQLHGESAPWTLALTPHPEHLGSLRGELSQGDRRHRVVADLDGSEFTMEESHNGYQIAATWLGHLNDGQCAHRIVGQRLVDTQTMSTSQNFLMLKSGLPATPKP